MKRAGTTPTPAHDTADDWRQWGSCGSDPDLFFPNGDTGPWLLFIEEAKTVCTTRCPVLDECLTETLRLERGLSASSRHGIAGGLQPEERAVLDTTPRRINQNA